MIRTLSIEIKELQELIEQERTAEEKVRKAKEEAGAIVKKAREEATLILEAIDSDSCWDEIRRTRKEETARKKAEMEAEHGRKISALSKTVEENFERAVTYIVKEMLRVGL